MHDKRKKKKEKRKKLRDSGVALRFNTFYCKNTYE